MLIIVVWGIVSTRRHFHFHLSLHSCALKKIIAIVKIVQLVHSENQKITLCVVLEWKFPSGRNRHIVKWIKWVLDTHTYTTYSQLLCLYWCHSPLQGLMANKSCCHQSNLLILRDTNIREHVPLGPSRGNRLEFRWSSFTCPLSSTRYLEKKWN